MPRTPRHAPGGLIFHVLNRGNARAHIFDEDQDYKAFQRVLAGTLSEVPMSPEPGRLAGSSAGELGHLGQSS